MNIRTVYKALAKLRAYDLIENYDDGVHSGIRVKIGKTRNEIESEKSAGPEQEEKSSDTLAEKPHHEKIFPCAAPFSKKGMGHASDREDEASDEYSLFEKIASEASLTPKFNLVRIPRNDYLALSEPQYRELLRLVSPEVLNSYFRRFEKLLEKSLNEGNKTPHSHYKVIRKWILDDFGCEV